MYMDLALYCLKHINLKTLIIANVRGKIKVILQEYLLQLWFAQHRLGAIYNLFFFFPPLLAG